MGGPFEVALKQVEDLLVEQIPLAIRAENPKEKLYCVMIDYCGEDFSATWPPCLGIGTESIREEQYQRWGRGATTYDWCPEGTRNIPICLPSARTVLEKACQRSLD